MHTLYKYQDSALYWSYIVLKCFVLCLQDRADFNDIVRMLEGQATKAGSVEVAQQEAKPTELKVLVWCEITYSLSKLFEVQFFELKHFYIETVSPHLQLISKQSSTLNHTV